MKKFLRLILVFSMVLMLFSCNKTQVAQNESTKVDTLQNETTKEEITKEVKVVDLGIVKDKQFGAINIDMKKEDFLNHGFEFGDSVDISFTNDDKTTFTDIPFYSGMYAKKDSLIMMNHNSIPTPIILIINGDLIYDKYKISDNDKVTIKLNTKGKYKEVQNTFDLHYSDNRDDYPSDEAFANFRCVKGSNLKDNLIYRGASSVDNTHKRTETVSKLLESNGIKYIIDLADNQKKYDKNLEGGNVTDYVKSIYDAGNLDLLGLGTSFRSEKNRKAVASALKKMTTSGAEKVYFHCLEGKDRAGFFGLLILALTGASYDEAVDDYMLSYKNYYNITKGNNLTKYNNIVDLNFNDYINVICDDKEIKDYKSVNLKENAEKYLLSGGLNEADIKAIENFLNK